MISKLAEQQIEKFKSEGLNPTFDDYILLNNIGLKVEHGEEMYSFSACPRMAFLGDNILREPSIAKRLWIDYAQQLFQDNVESKIYLIAYALGTADNELPDPHKNKEIEKAIIKFRDNVLIKFTETQILSALEWCLNGIKPDLNVPEKNKDEPEDISKIFDVPENDLDNTSIAKQLMMQAYSSKIEFNENYTLLEDLERMILIAAMTEGADIIKNKHLEWSAKFYIASGHIHERLMREKENGKK